MKYTVTGGTEGNQGISVGTRRYEPGDVIELTQAKAGWLLDKGLIEPATRGKATADDQVEDLDTDVPTEDDTTDTESED
jgi:hypothetical protein